MDFDNQSSFSGQDIKNSEWLPLSSDESIIAWGHPSLYTHLPSVVLGALLSLVGIILPFVTELGLIPLVIVPVGIAIFGLEYIKYVSVVYVFTDKRVFRKRGIIRNYTSDTEYVDVKTVRTTHGIIERLLNFGDIHISTSGADGGDLNLHNVPEAHKAYEYINEHVVGSGYPNKKLQD